MEDPLIGRTDSDTLRLREAGMMKATPNKIVADSADWRFLNQLKRELKS
jgi:NitT/TauT family transport system substrate-binding protein